MAVEVVDNASPFVLEQITGPKRVVRLTGRAMPEGTFDLEGTQRMETTWYPGNAVGTQTVLGASEEPTTIHGEWNDKFLGDQSVGPYFTLNGQRIATARDAAVAIDAIRREGQQVRLTWFDEVRVGLIKTFSKSWLNRRDLQWEIEFEWASQGEDDQTPVLTPDQSVSEAATELQALQVQLVDAVQPVFPTSPDFSNNMEEGVRALDTSVAQVASAAQTVAIAATAPSDAARRTIAASTGIITQSRTMESQVAVQPARALRQGATLGAMSLGDIVSSEVYARGISNSAVAMRRQAVSQRETLLRDTSTDLLAIFDARGGEDLRDVAQMFYGDPFEWRNLLVFNLLGSTLLNAGQVVLIPRLQRSGT